MCGALFIRWSNDRNALRRGGDGRLIENLGGRPQGDFVHGSLQRCWQSVGGAVLLRPLSDVAKWCKSVVSTASAGRRSFSDLTGISDLPLRIP
jgi:hypothetical protein